LKENILIKIFGKDNCVKCEEIKVILENKNITFEYYNDLKTLMVIGSKARIMSAPIIEYNEKYYSMEDFLKEL
jgi:glutaredoxin